MYYTQFMIIRNVKPFLENLLTKTGEIIMEHRSAFEGVKEKEKHEIVTPADLAANDYILEQLKREYPNIPVYTEEGNKEKSESNTRWIIDPLDGTTPWVWGNSGFSISVALEEKGEVVVGSVYDPVMKELFFASKGNGATRNGKTIHPAIGLKTEEMFMVVDWGNKDEKREEGLNYFRQFFVPDMFAKRVVPQFAPALGLCHVAEGRIHALVCNDTWLEDHSAGALILKEAGGYVSNFYNTDNFNHREFGIIATNEIDTHTGLVRFLKEKGVSIS
jgi:myo-inositol-1(or 4)-monophosphatase